MPAAQAFLAGKIRAAFTRFAGFCFGFRLIPTPFATGGIVFLPRPHRAVCRTPSDRQIRFLLKPKGTAYAL